MSKKAPFSNRFSLISLRCPRLRNISHRSHVDDEQLFVFGVITWLQSLPNVFMRSMSGCAGIFSSFTRIRQLMTEDECPPSLHVAKIYKTSQNSCVNCATQINVPWDAEHRQRRTDTLAHSPADTLPCSGCSPGLSGALPCREERTSWRSGGYPAPQALKRQRSWVRLMN